MTINKFAVLISELEDGKKEIDIAQIKEILGCIDEVLDGWLYRQIKSLKVVNV